MLLKMINGNDGGIEDEGEDDGIEDDGEDDNDGKEAGCADYLMGITRHQSLQSVCCPDAWCCVCALSRVSKGVLDD